MSIFLIRHTTPDIPLGVCYGQSDVPLATSYPEELRVIQDALRSASIDVWFSSPLTRCRQLAADLSKSDVTVDNRLLELNFGDWELQAWNDIDQTEAAFWGDNYITQPCPHGESFSQLHARVGDFWQSVIASHKKHNIAIVTHGGVIRSMLAHAQGTPLEKAFDRDIAYGSIIEIPLLVK